MSDLSAASPAPGITADAPASGVAASAVVNGGPVESAPAKDSNAASTAEADTSAAPAEDASSAKVNTNGTSSSSAGINGSGHSAATKTEDLPVQPAKEDAVMQDASAPAASSASASDADKLASREITPALSEAVSDTGSASTSTPAPAEGITASAALEVNDGIPELPFPLSEYKFANTSLPVASTSTTPFFFQSNPAVQLDESWTRSKRSDDPAAWDEPDRDYGYFATPEELEASRVRENARKAKVQQRLRKLNLWKGKGREEELASPPPPPVPSGRGYPKARQMEKLASADGTAPAPPRRGRPPKSALQQQVKASPAPTPARAASPPAQRSPQKSPPAPRAPARPATRFERKLVDQLLPDDAQTATPIYLEPHPAFIDLYDLPPYYLPDGPVQPGPAPPPRQAAATPAPAPSRQVSSAPAPTPAAAAPAPAPPPSFATAAPPPAPPPAQAAAPAPTPTTLPAASALPALPPLAAPSPAPSVDDQWIANAAGGAGTNKRARGAEDDGKRTGRKKARESSIASNASGPGPDEPPLGPPVNWIVQSTTCLSKKVEGQVRCFQCIARSIGHGCSFNGVRSFGVDYLGRIVTAPKFRSTSLPDNTPYFDKKLTKPLSLHESELVKTWLAPHLKPIVKQEYRLSQLPTAIKIHHDLSMHRLCDHCNTAQVGAVYMCQKCGRMACKPCHDTLIKIEKAETMNTGDVSTIMDIQRRRKCIAKKRGKDATGAEIHRSEQFIPLTVFKGDDLFDLYKEISEWDRTRMLAATDPKTYAYLRRKFSVKSNLATYDINTHQVNTVEFEALTEPIYFELWRMGEPVLVRHVPRGGMARFSPKTIAERFPGNTKIDLVNNYGTDSLTSTASSFFSQFNEGDFRRVDKDGNISYRTKDFPNARHFRNELKDMIEEFWKILPLPNILHPNGIYNMLAHTPSNASQPDLGPRATCSWETNAKWSTTLLRTDCTDIASYMWWGGKDAETKKPLRVRWDVFKAEDADKLREFCFEMQHKRAMKPQTPQKYKETHDDPLLYPQMYLTKSMRLELFKKHGIQPFPIYQFEGDLVLVPAGCPYQVSSWVDHLSMTVSFLAGARAGEAVKVNKAFHDQTKERAAWRQDKVQLESQLLWAWRSMEAWENEHPEIVEEAAAAAAKAKEEEKAKKEAAEAPKAEDSEAKTDGEAKKDDSAPAMKADVKPDVKEAAAAPAPAQPQEDTPMANAAAALPPIPQPAAPAPPVIPAAPPAAPPAAAAPSALAPSASVDPSSAAAVVAGLPPVPPTPQAPPAASAQPNGTA